MISHKHKYIFIHIPKCGGTSMESFLLSLEGIERPKSLAKLPKEIKKRYHLNSGVKGHAFHKEFDITLRKKYFSFTFVRNPFDRAVSEYRWDLQFKNSTFLDFLQKQEKWQIRHNHSQCEFIDEDMDFIGRFENLQADFDIVCERIGIPQQKLPHKNKTEHKHYSEYYNDETRQIVAQKFAKDIEHFGYEFGG